MMKRNTKLIRLALIFSALAVIALSLHGDDQGKSRSLLEAPASGTARVAAATTTFLGRFSPATIERRETTAILLLSCLLVLVSMLIETAIEAIEEAGQHDQMAPIIESMFTELTLLGFLSAIFFVVSKAEVTGTLSFKLFGSRDRLDELFEEVHMVLFGIMVIFLLSCAVLFLLARRVMRRYDKRHTRIMSAPAKIIADFADAHGDDRGEATRRAVQGGSAPWQHATCSLTGIYDDLWSPFSLCRCRAADRAKRQALGDVLFFCHRERFVHGPLAFYEVLTAAGLLENIAGQLGHTQAAREVGTKTHRYSHERAARMFMRMDINHDGGVSKEEFEKALDKRVIKRGGSTPSVSSARIITADQFTRSKRAATSTPRGLRRKSNIGGGAAGRHGKRIPSRFAFDMYLMINMANCIARLVHISFAAWGQTLIVLLLVYVVRSVLVESNRDFFTFVLVFFYGLLALLLLVHRQLDLTARQMLPVCFLSAVVDFKSRGQTFPRILRHASRVGSPATASRFLGPGASVENRAAARKRRRTWLHCCKDATEMQDALRSRTWGSCFATPDLPHGDGNGSFEEDGDGQSVPFGNRAIRIKSAPVAYHAVEPVKVHDHHATAKQDDDGDGGGDEGSMEMFPPAVTTTADRDPALAETQGRRSKDNVKLTLSREKSRKRWQRASGAVRPKKHLMGGALSPEFMRGRHLTSYKQRKTCWQKFHATFCCLACGVGYSKQLMPRTLHAALVPVYGHGFHGIEPILLLLQQVILLSSMGLGIALASIFGNLRLVGSLLSHGHAHAWLMLVAGIAVVIGIVHETMVIIAGFVWIYRVEAMKDRSAISIVNRRAHTRIAFAALKAIRALRLASSSCSGSLAAYCTQGGAHTGASSPSHAPKNGGRRASVRDAQGRLTIPSARETYLDPLVYEAKREEFKDLFDLFDRDRSGYISKDEFQSLWKLISQSSNGGTSMYEREGGDSGLKTAKQARAKAKQDAEELDIVMRIIDVNKDGQIGFTELFNYLAMHDAGESEADIEQMVESLFGMLDVDGSGMLTSHEFTEAMVKKLGAKLSYEDVQAIVNELDEDGDGCVDKEEFCNMLKKFNSEVNEV